MRVFYECRDHPHPAGGIRRLYRHVEILNKHGIAAYVLHHKPPFRYPWVIESVPIMYWTPEFAFTEHDVLVIPEGHTDIMAKTMSEPCCRVGLSLGWSRIYLNLSIGQDWHTFGIRHAIAGSRYDQIFIEKTMGLKSAVLVSGIDTELFRPCEEKYCQITYMPAKNLDYFHLIACAFRSMFRHFEHVPFVSISGLPHGEVASTLGSSAIFLAHTFPEGLSRKALEAMACGCLVVGYAGRGSLEFMEHEDNCYVADDADILTAAQLLGRAVQEFLDGKSSTMQTRARETAERYGLAREENAVLAHWVEFLRSL